MSFLINTILAGAIVANTSPVEYTTPGTYYLKVPFGANTISVQGIGGGAGGGVGHVRTVTTGVVFQEKTVRIRWGGVGGGAGENRWANGIPVNPFEMLEIVVGAGGNGAPSGTYTSSTGDSNSYTYTTGYDGGNTTITRTSNSQVLLNVVGGKTSNGISNTGSGGSGGSASTNTAGNSLNGGAGQLTTEVSTTGGVFPFNTVPADPTNNYPEAGAGGTVSVFAGSTTQGTEASGGSGGLLYGIGNPSANTSYAVSSGLNGGVGATFGGGGGAGGAIGGTLGQGGNGAGGGIKLYFNSDYGSYPYRAVPESYTTPSSFNFTNVVDLDFNTVYESANIVISNFYGVLQASVSNGALISVDGGTYVQNTSIVSGQNLRFKATSGSTWGITNTFSINVGTVSDTVSISTKIAAQTFTTNTSWTVPSGVSSLSILCVGAGGGGEGGGTNVKGANAACSGGGGGALSYTNNISVTAGETLNITVGVGGTAGQGSNGAATAGGNSQVIRASNSQVLVRAVGGGAATQGTQTTPGTAGAGGAAASGVGGVRYSGGSGGTGSVVSSTSRSGAGGGGASGYSGNGGAGASLVNASAGSGGGGGGGSTRGGTSSSRGRGSGGGGVGVSGEGTSGSAGIFNSSNDSEGKGGSGGSRGTDSTSSGGPGGAAGGGGGGSRGDSTSEKGGNGAAGRVAIIWAGNTWPTGLV